MSNPFQNTSRLNRPLRVELCQQIMFTALRATAPDDESCMMMSIKERRTLAHTFGPNVYLLHPDDIAQIFHGITTAVYVAVQDLFCSSLYRTPHMVWRILTALADDAAVAAPTYEAIWALCTYMQSARDQRYAPAIEHTPAQWSIGWGNLPMVTSPVHPTPSGMVWVVRDVPEQVLAFRFYSDQITGELLMDVVYDAVISQRHPAVQATAGIHWSFPQRVMSTGDLPEGIQRWCAATGIPLTATQTRPSIVADLEGWWPRAVTGRRIPSERFALLLDNYLEKCHGYGPRKAYADATYAYRHLDGYNRDPALILPALRHLLPFRPAAVNAEGSIVFDGRRYHALLLRHWRNTPVLVQQSRHDPRQAYISIDGDILCAVTEPRA